MTLDELKERLGIAAEDTSRDGQLSYMLADAIAFVEAECGNVAVTRLPQTVNKVIMRYVQYELHTTPGVLTESLAGMSQTFESSEARDKSLSRDLGKLGLRMIRFQKFHGTW